MTVKTHRSKYTTRGDYHWREVSASLWHGWPYTRSRVQWIVQHCSASQRVLEVGCGDGVILGQLAASGKQVVGVDTDETALRFARQHFRTQGLHGLFTQTIPPGYFDTIIMAEVIEHLDDARDVLDELVLHLTPDGRLLLTTPIKLLEHSPDALHVHEYQPDELTTFLGTYFHHVTLTTMHPVWALDWLCRRPVRIAANLLYALTGYEWLDHVTSPLGVYWTQAIVATGPKR